MAGAIPRPGAGPAGSAAVGAARPARPPVSASAAGMSRPRRAGRCASRAAKIGGPAKRDAPCRAPRRRPLRPLRDARARRQGLLRPVRQNPLQKRRNHEAKREADRRRYAERRARGDCTSCGKPARGAAECQACCDAARARYDARRAAGVCVKCQTPTYGGTAYCAPCAVAKAERRDREAEYAARRAAVCRPAGQGSLRRVRGAVAGGGALRALFAQAPRELGGVSRHPDLGPELDGDRDRHRPGARSL